MTAVVLRGDAAHLPLPDGCVDLLLCSPPYWSLRSYADNGEHYAGQIGSEETPGEYIAALLRCTREWARVLKPGGNIFVNLSDKYAGGGQGGNVGGHLQGNPHLNLTPATARAVPAGFRAKSLLGLPARYMLGCIDDLGLICRRDIIWRKTNPTPESVEDRCPSAHEYLFHFALQQRHYAAADEIRLPLAAPQRKAGASAFGARDSSHPRAATGAYAGQNPLGKIPGSVWDIPTESLVIPDRVTHERCCGGRRRPGCEDGLRHDAAWPAALARQVILGWSPPGICRECGDSRRPVASSVRTFDGQPRDDLPAWADPSAPRRTPNGAGHWRFGTDRRHLGYACACPRPDAPTSPALVVDVFGGTGTSAVVADVLGRTGITVDRSADYCRLARWRTTDPGERARALGVPKPPPVSEGQGELDLFGESA